MTEKEYRQHPAISRSALFKISESPEKFKYAQEHPEEPTPALIFGQVLHKIILEPDTFSDQFIIAPKVDRRTKAGKAEWAEFVESAKDKTVIDEDMFFTACEMKEAVLCNDFAKRLLDGEHEKPFFWTDEMTGEECKCRVDCLTAVGDDLIIVDVKSTNNAETEAFTRSAIKYGYDMQVAMYCEGVEKNTGKKPLFVFIAIEKEPPYAINIMQADELLHRRGYDLFRELIGIYHDCKQTGNWYGYLGKYNQINNLALPAWLAKEVE